MKQESPITLQGHTLKIGSWQAPSPENIQDLLLFYQVTKTEKGTYDATLTLKFQHEQIPSKGIQPYENPFPIEFHKNLPTFLREFEATKLDKAPYKLQYDMATLAQEERLFAATRQAFWDTHFQDVINPLLEIQAQGKIGQIWLCVSSQEAFVRNLPWELMLRPNMVAPNSPQQIPKLTIVRTSSANLQDFELQSRPKAEDQLKLLFVTALPERLEERHKLLQVEYEQKRLIESLSEQDQGIVEIDFAEIASLEEIDALLTEGKHHILHISGHGDFKQPTLSPEQAAAAPYNLPETKGLLVLEDEDGNRVDTSGQELGTVLKKHNSLQLVVMSNCNSGKAGAHGLAEEVAAQGIPAVIGMRFTVTDHAAMEFTTALYSELAKGKSLAEAFRNGQDALYWNPYADGERYEDTEWFTPVLFSRQVMGAIVDVELVKNASSERLAAKLKAQADHLGNNFIGRRRYLARIKRILEGPEHLCLFGMKGIGKSELAKVAARNYAGENVVVVTEPQDMQAHFAQGQKAVVIVEVLDHRNTGYWRMVGELLDLKAGPKVIVVSYHGIQIFGDQVEAMAVWKLSYAEQWRLIEQSAAFGRWRPQDERPSLQDLAGIFDALDGHVGAIRLLEKAMVGYRGNDYACEIARQLPVILEEVQSHLTFDEIMDEVENLVLTASVFFEPSPFAALMAVAGKSEELFRKYLSYAQLWGWCFFDGEVFEVHGIVRAWIWNEGFLAEEDWKRVALGAGRYFSSLGLSGNLESSIAYFDLAEAWDDFASVSLSLGQFCERIGFYEKALTLEKAVLMKTKRKHFQCDACMSMGTTLFKLGEMEEALRIFKIALERSREIQSPVREAAALNNICQVYNYYGDFSSALAGIELSLKIDRMIGNRNGEATTLNNLGMMHAKGNPILAMKYVQESLEIYREIGNALGEAGALNNISQFLFDIEEYANSRTFLENSLQIYQAEGYREAESAVLNNFGTNAFINKKFELAAEYFTKSIEIQLSIGGQTGLAKSLHNLGTVLFVQKQIELAIPYFLKAYKILSGLGSSERVETSEMLEYARESIGDSKFQAVLYDLGIENSP